MDDPWDDQVAQPLNEPEEDARAAQETYEKGAIEAMFLTFRWIQDRGGYVKCPACLEWFLKHHDQLFIMFGCGHGMCKGCLTDKVIADLSQNSNAQTIHCALCRTPFPVPGDILVTAAAARAQALGVRICYVCNQDRDAAGNGCHAVQCFACRQNFHAACSQLHSCAGGVTLCDGCFTCLLPDRANGTVGFVATLHAHAVPAQPNEHLRIFQMTAPGFLFFLSLLLCYVANQCDNRRYRFIFDPDHPFSCSVFLDRNRYSATFQHLADQLFDCFMSDFDLGGLSVAEWIRIHGRPFAWPRDNGRRYPCVFSRLVFEQFMKPLVCQEVFAFFENYQQDIRIFQVLPNMSRHHIEQMGSFIDRKCRDPRAAPAVAAFPALHAPAAAVVPAAVVPAAVVPAADVPAVVPAAVVPADVALPAPAFIPTGPAGVYVPVAPDFPRGIIRVGAVQVEQPPAQRMRVTFPQPELPFPTEAVHMLEIFETSEQHTLFVQLAFLRQQFMNTAGRLLEARWNTDTSMATVIRELREFLDHRQNLRVIPNDA